MPAKLVWCRQDLSQTSAAVCVDLAIEYESLYFFINSKAGRDLCEAMNFPGLTCTSSPTAVAELKQTFF